MTLLLGFSLILNALVAPKGEGKVDRHSPRTFLSHPDGHGLNTVIGAYLFKYNEVLILHHYTLYISRQNMRMCISTNIAVHAKYWHRMRCKCATFKYFQIYNCECFSNVSDGRYTLGYFW